MEESPSLRDAILKEVTQFYLKSRDFNGIPINTLNQRVGGTSQQVRSELRSLLDAELVLVEFGIRFPNPHILAFAPKTKEDQLKEFDSADFAYACIYPRPKHLRPVVNRDEYEGKPFTLRLALGEPQLSFSAFDLNILELYRSDPRYHYDSTDIMGSISVRSEFYESGKMRSSDEVFLKGFGFAYDKEMNRAVAVFLCDLADLSPEHQQIWNAKKLDGDYTLHPDFARMSMGEWPEREPIFVAFLEEIRQINAMCRLIGWPALFRTEPDPYSKPNHFGFLIRPTAKEFNDFVLVLDKLLSENINKTFFQGKIRLTREETLHDGRVRVQDKGTIALLEEWLKRNFRPSDPEPMEQAFVAMREVRKLRQNPAHKLEDNIFDQQFFKTQRDLMVRVYTAIRTVRLILANHPKAKSHKVPDWLFKGEIWTY